MGKQSRNNHKVVLNKDKYKKLGYIEKWVYEKNDMVTVSLIKHNDFYRPLLISLK